MKRSYWEKIAPSYNDEIFDVLHYDKKAIIRSEIRKLSSSTKIVADIGCAIGKWLPVLSPAFKKVFAVDISARNLAIAKKNYPFYKNVEYVRADMSGKRNPVKPCDVAICINAILTSSLKSRIAFFKSLASGLKKGGHLILVVPSLESWLLSQIIGDRLRIDRKILDVKISGTRAIKKWKDLKQGNVEIDSVPTKHYTKEELQFLLTQQGFTVARFKKIEYNWKTEFLKPPRSLKEPYPWDWMVVAKKIEN